MTKISKECIYDAVARDNNFAKCHMVTDWYWDCDGSELVFCTNKRTHETEHYTVEEFIRQMSNYIEGIEGCDTVDMLGDFFVFKKEGAEVASSSIPENPRIEKAFVKVEYWTSQYDRLDLEERHIGIPAEVVAKQERVKDRKPYFALEVIEEVAEDDLPEWRRHYGEPSVYWVIPDAQLRRIEFTMWRNNQFAKVFDFGTAEIPFTDGGTKRLYGWMDGHLYTEDGKRVMLASDQCPRLFTHSPAFAHVGSRNIENTHSEFIG